MFILFLNVSLVTVSASQTQKFWLILLPTASTAGEGNGTPLQYSCLENPMDRGAWWAAVHGVAKSWTRLSDFTSTFPLMHWRRKWQPTPVFLPGESQGGGAWWAAVCGVAQSGTRLKRLSRGYYYSPVRQKWNESFPHLSYRIYTIYELV